MAVLAAASLIGPGAAPAADDHDCPLFPLYPIDENAPDGDWMYYCENNSHPDMPMAEPCTVFNDVSIYPFPISHPYWPYVTCPDHCIPNTRYHEFQGFERPKYGEDEAFGFRNYRASTLFRADPVLTSVMPRKKRFLEVRYDGQDHWFKLFKITPRPNTGWKPPYGHTGEGWIIGLESNRPLNSKVDPAVRMVPANHSGRFYVKPDNENRVVVIRKR